MVLDATGAREFWLGQGYWRDDPDCPVGRSFRLSDPVSRSDRVRTRAAKLLRAARHNRLQLERFKREVGIALPDGRNVLRQSSIQDERGAIRPQTLGFARPLAHTPPDPCAGCP